MYRRRYIVVGNIQAINCLEFVGGRNFILLQIAGFWGTIFLRTTAGEGSALEIPLSVLLSLEMLIIISLPSPATISFFKKKCTWKAKTYLIPHPIWPWILSTHDTQDGGLSADYRINVYWDTFSLIFISWH